jgi:hypothetical protein
LRLEVGQLHPEPFSAACGSSVTAQSYNSFVLGAYNVTGTYNPNIWVATDPLFVIGNGTSATATSNAVTVLKNGNVGIGITTPNDAYKLDISGAVNATKYYQNGTLVSSSQWTASGNDVYYDKHGVNSGGSGRSRNNRCYPLLAQQL